jgi:hypothetical protein
MRSKKELKKARRRFQRRAWWAFITNNYTAYGVAINEVIKIEDELEEINA